MKQLTFLSYPRCGSHFLCYSIEKIFRTKTIRSEKRHVDVFRQIQETDDFRYRTDLKIYKNHGCSSQHEIINKYSTGLIFIIRNYKECVFRRLKSHTPNFTLKDVLGELNNKPVTVFDRWSHSFDYIRLLNYYDTFEHPKIIVYYEDLITDFEKEILRMRDFFSSVGIEEDEGSVQKFLDNIESHKEESIKQYHNEVERKGSQTKGKDLLYHSKQVDPSLLLKMDEHLSINFPELYEKYLTRYK